MITTELAKEMTIMAKQKDLIEGRGIQELDEAADLVQTITEKRLRLQEQEAEARSDLLEKMKKHGKNVYLYEGYKATIVPGEEKVSVKKIRESKVPQ